MSEWLVKAIVSMLFFIPGSFAVPVVQRNFGVRPEVILSWWLLGILLGVSVWLGSQSQLRLLMPSAPTLIVGLLGLTVGTVANICLYQSIAAAPNPGLPVAVRATNAAVVYVITPILVFVMPRYFHNLEFTWHHFLGVTLIVAGTVLVALKQ